MWQIRNTKNQVPSLAYNSTRIQSVVHMFLNISIKIDDKLHRAVSHTQSDFTIIPGKVEGYGKRKVFQEFFASYKFTFTLFPW